MCWGKVFSTALVFLLFFTLSSQQSLAQDVFYRYPDNPVMGGSGPYHDVGTPFVLKENETYWMWYARGYSPFPTLEICYKTSTDGKNWGGLGVALTPGPDSWDSEGIESPTVVRIGDTYYMGYAGTNGVIWRIGVATSLDRTTWYKHSGNPLFDRGEFGEWDSQGVRDPMAINDGTEFKLYYTGYDGSTYRIGLATSMDGLTWTRVPNNPVLSIGQPGEWDSMGIRHRFVFYDGDYYFMYYSGYAGIGAYGPGYSIGLAISTDGYNWEKQGIVLERADQYWFDNAGVSEPTGLLEPGIIKMWFVGKRTGRRRVGFAQSEPLFVDVTNYTPEVSPGDFLDFTVDVTNVSGDAVAYQLWSDATLPNGNPYSGNPVLGPQDLEVGPGETYTTNLSIFVPNQAPPNSGYALTTKVGGIYPRQIWDLTRFEFEILPLQ